MATININAKCDLNKPVVVRHLDGMVFSQDVKANMIRVSVFRDREPVDLSGGSVSANIIRADGATVVQTGTIEGNVCSVVLPSSAYAVPGQIAIFVKHSTSAGPTTSTIAAITGYVYKSTTDTIVDPGSVVPNVNQLLAMIEDCEDATEACIAATAAAPVVDDTAGAGDTNKVWSASKTYELKSAINTNLEELGFSAIKFNKIAGSGHSSTKDKLDVNIKSGQKFYVTVSQVGSENEIFYQLFGWSNGVSTRLIPNGKTSANRQELTASANYEQLSVYIGNDLYSGSAEVTLLFEQEESNLIEISTMKTDIAVMRPFFRVPDVAFVDGYGVKYTDGTLLENDTYSYCEVNVALFAGTTITGYSGTTGVMGIAFYDASGFYISGFGNPASGTYNWDINGLIPEGAVTAKVHCRISHQSSFWLEFDWSETQNNLVQNIADAQQLSDEFVLLKKKISSDIFIPRLRDGSAGNIANANSVSTLYVMPIYPNKDKIVFEYIGDFSLADEYAFSYCAFRGASDGMTSQAAFADASITKLNVNSNATTRTASTKFELLTTDVLNYDHIMFYLWRYQNGVAVPLRIATDQYNIRITYENAEGIQSQRDIDMADTKHDLLYAKHAKGNTGTRLTLLHFSDIHADTPTLARIMKDSEQFAFDDAICTGDIVGNSAEQISSWWVPSVMTCIGNHDSASYSSETGYNWTALSMADRSAYYIDPFISNWGNVVHASGKSYYYKDYANAKVRLIVMDAMLYSGTPGAEATEQTSWLNDLLLSAITNNLHVLIAIHAPHGGATAEVCSFSRYGQTAMSPQPDCNTPQTVIDAVATAINNGLHFIGYLVGHTHQDNIWDAEGDGKQLMYCVTCAIVSQEAQWKNSDQYRGTDADAYNLVTIDTANTLVKIVRGGGADMDDHMRTRKAICFNYSTGEKVGEVL